MSKHDHLALGVRLKTPKGITAVSLSVPRGPIRLSGVVPLAGRLTDILVDEAIVREQERGRTLTCTSGCGACCRQLVPISAPEAFLLADHVAGLSPERQRDVMARFDQLVQTLEQRGAVPMLRGLTRGFARADLSAAAAEYFSLSLPCPLLVNESCSAYTVRPLSCRDYNVTSPAEWCAEPTQHAIRKVPTEPGMSYPLARLTAKLTGSDPELIVLGCAMQWAETHAQLAFERWPGVTLLEGLLEELGILLDDAI